MAIPKLLFPAQAFRCALVASSFAMAALGGGCMHWDKEPESIRFAQAAHDVEVIFRGEVSDAELFGSDRSLLDRVQPIDETGRPRGTRHDDRPGWLHFEYRIDAERHEVLIAKKPLLSRVSWDDIARAGAAVGDDAGAPASSRLAAQNARVTDRRGNEYRVRLPYCGQATRAELSEWNLLIGGGMRPAKSS